MYTLTSNYRCLPNTSSSINYLYINARSILRPGKFDELKCILSTFKHTIHIILLTETWLKSDNDAKLIKIPNYSHYYNYRTDKTGGGVSIFVHNNLKHTVTEQQYVFGNNFLWIYIETYSLHIGLVYKPGDSNLQKFLDIFSVQLEKRKRTIVFGDFNINLLKSERNTNNYTNMLEEAGYQILNKITKMYCTRETETTKTIIDHVITNIYNSLRFQLSIIDSPMSDHKQICLEMLNQKLPKKQKRTYNAINYFGLYDSMKDAHNLTTIGYENLENMIKYNINKNTVQKVKILNLPQKDWINRNVTEGINHRNALWKKLKSNPTNKSLECLFQKQKDHVFNTIRNSKCNYYTNLFNQNKKNPRKM